MGDTIDTLVNNLVGGAADIVKQQFSSPQEILFQPATGGTAAPTEALLGDISPRAQQGSIDAGLIAASVVGGEALAPAAGATSGAATAVPADVATTGGASALDAGVVGSGAASALPAGVAGAGGASALGATGGGLVGVGEGAALNAGLGAASSAAAGGDPLKGAVAGGLGGLGGGIGGLALGPTLGTTAGTAIGSAAGGAAGGAATGTSPLAGAVQGAGGSLIGSALAPSTASAPAVSATAEPQLSAQDVSSALSTSAPSSATATALPGADLGSLSGDTTGASPLAGGGSDTAALPSGAGFSPQPPPIPDYKPAIDPSTGLATSVATGEANTSGLPTVSPPSILSQAGDFASKNAGLIAAAAPIALNLIRGQPSAPAAISPLQQGGAITGPLTSASGQLISEGVNQTVPTAGQPLTATGSVTSPLIQTEQTQLAAANAGTVTPGQQAQIDQYVQQQQTALYQSIANAGVANPATDSRFITGMQAIQQQAEVMKQNFINQSFTTGQNAATAAASNLNSVQSMIQNTLSSGFTAAGDAASALSTAANAQVQEDTNFQNALSSAITSFGLIAGLGGLKAAA